jgi:phosphoserine phosphatase
VEQLYIDTVEPTAVATLNALRADGWEIAILSGGFKRLIEPLARFLQIERVEAVPLQLDENGYYVSFDSTYPTTYNGGKPEIIQKLKSELKPDTVVMVGDGISDLETNTVVDIFVGFGGYTPRAKVKESADHFIYKLDELLNII